MLQFCNCHYFLCFFRFQNRPWIQIFRPIFLKPWQWRSLRLQLVSTLSSFALPPLTASVAWTRHLLALSKMWQLRLAFSQKVSPAMCRWTPFQVQGSPRVQPCWCLADINHLIHLTEITSWVPVYQLVELTMRDAQPESLSWPRRTAAKRESKSLIRDWSMTRYKESTDPEGKFQNNEF